jgi:hypothetical protein
MIGWSIGILALVLLALGVAYYVRVNLPVELSPSDVVGTWVDASGGPGVAVFHKDGTASIRGIPGGHPPSGQGKWSLSEFQGPIVDVQIASHGFSFSSKWDNFRTVLVTYSGDPDSPSSEHIFVRVSGKGK